MTRPPASSWFLFYAEISKRYLNNCDKYFGLYGRERPDLYPDQPKEKVLTVGSVDIGGGTTDLMINAYRYQSSGVAVLQPEPLYWESFSNVAGDDLLKMIIQNVIIEGKVNDPDELGCIGVIENEARKRGVPNIREKLNDFFGTTIARTGFLRSRMRKKFIIQVAKPIAEHYLEHARLEKEDQHAKFSDFFHDHKPSQDILDFFEKQFGFRFEDIIWKLSADRVNKIVENTFEPLMRKICTLLFVKGCDFVLLAGRPTSLRVMSELFLKYYPVPPNRLISLNEYRVGRWYPFNDGNGYFDDDYKTIVTVGACIALMGGKLDKLDGFRLNLDLVKKNLISTAEYFGTYDPHRKLIKDVFITPDENKVQLSIEGLPIMIGFKRLPAKTYPLRIIYSMDLNDDRIIQSMKEQYGDEDKVLLRQRAEEYKTNLKNRMPFTVRIRRDYRSDREFLELVDVVDSDRMTVNQNLIKFDLQTIDEEKGHWLDTGEFRFAN